jgi:hypothetical protein
MTDADDQQAGSPMLFLGGLVLFLGSLVAFVADLVTGHDILRSLAVNAVGVGILISWAAYDTLVDPESAVSSRGGAAGTGVLLCGLYLLLAAVVVAVTSVIHGRLELGLWAGGSGVVLVILGFLAFPTETLGGEEQAEDGVET